MNAVRTAAFAVAAAVASVALAGSNLNNDLGYLRGELEFRRDNNYAGDLDKTQKKELKAILKSLKTLDGAAEDLGDTIKQVAKVNKTLEKGFPSEFNPPGIPTSLPTLVSNLIADIVSDLQNDSSNLASQASSISDENLAQQAQDALNDFDDAMADYFSSYGFDDGAKYLGRAWKALERLQNVLDRAFPK